MSRHHVSSVMISVLSSTLLSLVVAACSSSDAGSAASGPSTCSAGEVLVTSCGGNEKSCVKYSGPSTCEGFDKAQPASDNPCNFGTRYSAACAELEAGHVSCACF